MASYMLAMDVGGTFLDTVVADSDGGVTTTKVLSTHDDYSKCISAAVAAISKKLGLSQEEFVRDCNLVINGTTVATNVLAQLQGPKVGLLITRGFADTQCIGRVQRWGAIDLNLLSPLPLIVPRERMLEVDERVDREGRAVRVLSRDHAVELVKTLVEDHQVEAIAVSLLWSFMHPEHEQLIKQVAAELYPDLPVSLSCEVFPAIREYERTNTTVIDAFIAPGVRKYLSELQAFFRDNGFGGTLRLVHAAGGVASVDEVRRAPVTLINSGPVAGYVGAMKFGKRIGRRNIITADVGGTSFDAGLIVDGQLALRHRTLVPAAGHPSPGYLTGLSMMDVSAIGTGGGSLGWIDTREMVRVGPQSAGSSPGPACFGRGGTRPTLTDACVILGLLDPQNFLGGSQTLDREAAVAAMRTHVAKPLGLDSEFGAAAAMYRLALADMASNVRRMSVEKGHDPRGFSLFSYGGAGGLFLASVSNLASVPEMVSPRNCAVFSALGALMSDYRRSAIRTCTWRSSVDTGEISRILASLEAQVREEVSLAGFKSEQATLERTADMRFVGQTSEITVPLPDGALGSDFENRLTSNFLVEYEREFGAEAIWPNTPVEMQNVRVTGVVESHTGAVTASVGDVVAEREAPEPTSHREVFWPFEMRARAWAIYDRAVLMPGHGFAGPAIVESEDTTVVVPPGCKARIDEHQNLIIDVSRHEAVDDAA